jgi:hypothetical protein
MSNNPLHRAPAHLARHIRSYCAVMLSGFALPQVGVAQLPERSALPRTALPRQEFPSRDLRPAGPAPKTIYGTALGATTAKVTWSTVLPATGYQLYRTAEGSTSATLIHSNVANPSQVIVVDPTAYQGPVLGPSIPYGGTPNTVPPIAYIDRRRSPKATYTYTVLVTFPDTAPYSAASSTPASLYMPPGLPPAGLSATTDLGTKVTLSWQPVVDATGYIVFRDKSRLTTQAVRGTSYVDTPPQPGLYTYSVASYFSTEAAGEIEGEMSPLPSIEVILSGCPRP